MNRAYSRRDSVKLLGSAALGASLVPLRPAAAMVPPRAEDLRGIFVILSTPYTDSGELDFQDLAFQVEWLQHAGVHGLVWPQNSSDYPQLTAEEIRRGMEVLAEA